MDCCSPCSETSSAPVELAEKAVVTVRLAQHYQRLTAASAFAAFASAERARAQAGSASVGMGSPSVLVLG